MSYTLGTAAKATGKSKSTIKRALEKGLISAERQPTGEWRIEPVELHRVYPVANGGTVPQGVPDGTVRNGAERAESAILQERVAGLERQLEQERATVEDLRCRLDAEAEERRKLTALLTDQRQRSPQKAVEGRLSRAWSVVRGQS